MTVSGLTLKDGAALLAAVDEAGVLYRWDAATGEPIGTLVHSSLEGGMRMTSLTLPGGRALLACLDMNGTLARWDATTGEPIGTPLSLGEDATAVTGVRLDGGGRLFVSTVHDLIQVRDAVTGTATNAELTGANSSALTRPDGSVLLATGNALGGDMHLHHLHSSP